MGIGLLITPKKIKPSEAYHFELNQKNSFYIKNTNELLAGKDLLQNELYRIGGINTIRGFNEQSIFTSKYSVNSVEYHYNLTQTTHLYTITDIAFLLDDFTNTTTKLYGIGLGYFSKTKNRILNLSYVTRKTNQHTFNLKNSKIHIKITYIF